MTQKDLVLTVLLSGLFALVIWAAVSIFDSTQFENGYRLGQVDALTGKVKYELVTKPDSTRTWVKKKNPPLLITF